MFRKKEENSTSLSEVYSKQSRKRRLVLIFVSLLAAYAIFLGVAWIIVRSPIFRIQHIEVVGNKNISSEDAVTLVRAEMSANSFTKRMLGFRNMLAWPGTVSEKTLALLPEVKAISVKRSYRKRTLTVRIEERRPFALWCVITPAAEGNGAGDKGCFWFDSEGVIFKRSISAEGNLISSVSDYSGRGVGLGSMVIPQSFLPNLFSVLRAVSESGISVKEVRLDDLNLQEIEASTYEGPKVYFSIRFPSDSAAAVIRSLMNEGKFRNLEYLDFRVENRAYYK